MECRRVLKSRWLLAVALLAAFLPLAAAAEDWPMFRANPARTGWVTSPGATDGASSWVFPTGGPVRSSPAVVDGTVYFGSDDGNVYAVNASSGRLIWSAQTGGPVRSSPAVSGGYVFVGGLYGLFRISADTGDVELIDDRSPVDTAPVIAAGWVFFVNRDGRMVGIEHANPASNASWELSLPEPTSSSPAFQDGKLFVFSGDQLVVIEAEGGLGASFFIPLPGGGGGAASPALHENALYYVGVSDSKLYAIQLDNDSSGIGRCFTHESSEFTGIADASPAVSAAGVVFRVAGDTGVATVGPPPSGGDSGTTAENGWLQVEGCGDVQPAAFTGQGMAPLTVTSRFAANRRSSRNVQRFRIPAANSMQNDGSQAPAVSSPALAGTTIVFVAISASGNADFFSIRVWDYASGDPTRQFDLDPQGRAIESSPAVANGALYVGCNDGNLYAVALATGEDSAA